MRTTESLAARARELDELVNGRPENVEAALPQLDTILGQTREGAVLIEAVTALGHAWDARAVEMILAKVGVDHADANVRLAVACALPNGVDPRSACWQRVIAALIALSSDSETEVRNWACFGLGQINASSSVARDALALRLSDPDDTTRCEALRALATTGDRRALTALQERLSVRGSETIWELELQAAAVLADAALYPALLRLEDDWRGDEDDLMSILAFAIRRCQPEAPKQAANVERAYVARVNALLAADELTRDLSATLSGTYPRTKLTVTGPDANEPDASRIAGWDELWDDQEPSNYPLEREVESVLLTLKDVTRSQRSRRPS